MTKRDSQQQLNHDTSSSSSSSVSSQSLAQRSASRYPMPPNHCILVKPINSDIRLAPPYIPSSSSFFTTSSPTSNFNPILNSSLMYHFNARMFCFHSSLCLSRRTLTSPGTHYQPLSVLQAPPSCRRATPALVDIDDSVESPASVPSCAHLEAINNCAFAMQHGERNLTCPPRMVLQQQHVGKTQRQYWLSVRRENDDNDDDDTNSINSSSSEMMIQEEEDGEEYGHATVVVPAYICLYNIYHYVHVIEHVVQVVASLDSLLPLWKSGLSPPSSSPPAFISKQGVKRVTLLFRGDLPSGYGRWQHDLTKLFIEHRLKSGLGLQSVTVKSLFEDEFQPWFAKQSSSRHLPAFLHLKQQKEDKQQQQQNLICARNAVVLGFRQSNAWPFANAIDFQTNNALPNSLTTNTKTTSILSEEGSVLYNNVKGHDLNDHSNLTGVPAESITFRATVYKGLNLTSIMDVSKILSSQLSNPPIRLLLDLPPLTLGYARRNRDTRRDPKPGQYIRGRARRFSDADEQWFISMLSTIVHRHNLSQNSVLILEPKEHTPFAQQVLAYKDVGILVGIHGANLVNALFMHPFTGLVELANDYTKCYIRGGNAGLNYWHFIPSRIASVEESFCGPENKKCLNHMRNRRIMIDGKEDREKVQSIVDFAVGRIVRFRRMFEHLGGVPVVYNRRTAEYEIDWSMVRKENDDDDVEEVEVDVE